MTWIVDTCVLLDIHLNDATFGHTSAACLAHFLPQGLAITSTTFIELGPAFRGDIVLAEAFLDEVGVAHQALPRSVQGLAPAWSEDDTTYAFAAWHRQTQVRRASGGVLSRRPVADLFIATVARRFAGIVTRNGAHFQAFDSGPSLKIVDPTQSSTWT